MHDEAILVKGSGKVAPNGHAVTISTVEAVYKNTAAANSAESFKCADANCFVPVIAVITQATKSKRKQSPSSYFRAASAPHKPGCTRQSNTSTPSAASTNSELKPATPQKAKMPTIWRDPSAPSSEGSGSAGEDVANPSSGGAAARRSTTGTGSSKQTSSQVRVFAKYWKDMAPFKRAAKELDATWNPGRTFETAFFDLTTSSLVETPSPKRIYYGTVEKIFPGVSGYILTLTQRHGADDKDLRIWVKKEIQESNPSGKALWERLKASNVKRGDEVFALGQFVITEIGRGSWHSLAISHGRNIWAPEH